MSYKSGGEADYNGSVDATGSRSLGRSHARRCCAGHRSSDCRTCPVANRREHGVGPGRAGDGTSRSGDAGRSLLAREEQLGALQAAIKGARDGKGSVVLVEGAAGLGKSALIDAANQLGQAAGMRVLRARASELEAGFGFGVVRQLLQPAVHQADARALARLLQGPAALARAALDDTDDAAPAGPAAGFATLHGLYWLCANLCERQALLLSVDDVHWSDPPSLRFLTFLAPRAEEHRMVLVMSMRPEQQATAEALGCLQALRHTTTTRPRPLSQVAVAQMVCEELGRPEPAFARACHEAVAGNPFLLRELIAELRHERVRPTTAASARVADIAPRAVSRTMLARIASLPAAAAPVARAVAILGDGAAPRHVRALAGLDPKRAAEAADALARVSILRREDRLAFVHPIVRRAVEQDIPPRERSRAHATAAQLLRADGLPAERVAPHLLAAEPDGDPTVVQTLRAAANAAIARGAPEVAARYLRRAHAEPPPARVRADVLRELGRSELLTGDVAGLEQLRGALALVDDSEGHVELALELSHFLVAAGAAPDAVAVLEQALARLAGRGRHPELRLRLLAAITAAATTDLRTSGHAHRRMVRLQEPPGRTPGERMVLVQHACFESRAGRSAARCIDLARRALMGGTLLGEATIDTQMLVAACCVLQLSGEPEEAHTVLSAAIERCRAAGAVMAFATHCSFRGLTAAVLGRLDDAEADVRAALAFTTSPMLVTTIHGYATSFLADVLIERGDLDAAEELLQPRAARLTDARTHDATNVLLSRARLRLARHQAAAALEDLHECARLLRGWGIVNPAWSDWRSLAVLAHLALGDRDTALRLSAEELELARGFGAPRSLGVALRSRALAEGGPTGIQLLQEAVTTLEASPAALEHARTLVELGAALRRDNRRADARTPLRRALDVACRCRATALVVRAREELAAAGARPRRDLLTGIDALTATELRVARLGAQGMTNREIAQSLFVTTKTIETHLAHAYSKLDIRSRADLAAALTRPSAGG